MSDTIVLRGPERLDFLCQEVLADIFEATALAHPEQIALIEGQGEQLRQRSYAEQDGDASRAAHRLIEAGIRPGDMVGLWLPRGMDLLTLQLGIAKWARPGCLLTARCPPSASPSAWTMPAPGCY